MTDQSLAVMSGAPKPPAPPRPDAEPEARDRARAEELFARANRLTEVLLFACSYARELERAEHDHQRAITMEEARGGMGLIENRVLSINPRYFNKETKDGPSA